MGMPGNILDMMIRACVWVWVCVCKSLSSPLIFQFANVLICCLSLSSTCAHTHTHTLTHLHALHALYVLQASFTLLCSYTIMLNSLSAYHAFISLSSSSCTHPHAHTQCGHRRASTTQQTYTFLMRYMAEVRVWRKQRNNGIRGTEKLNCLPSFCPCIS